MFKLENGEVTFWGLSPALDLFDEYISNFPVIKEKEEAKRSASPLTEVEVKLNILIFGGGDIRHIIKTLAKMYTHKAKCIRPIIDFYVVDNFIDITARNIALLSVALENSKTFSLSHKVRVFMDIYGNTLMRPVSQQYLIGKAKVLTNIVTDDECRKRLAPFLNLNHLKYKEKDSLTNAFNFWQIKQQYIFDIKKYWSDNVRNSMGIRFDYKNGAFDWDLNMILKCRRGQQICTQEYIYWRNKGIAFTYPEFEYNKPNKTFSVGLSRNGDEYSHCGYNGDIRNGPYSAFGLTCKDKRLLNSAHGQNEYRSTDITSYNLHELFYEIANGTQYECDVSQLPKYGSIKLQMGKNFQNDESDVDEMQDYVEPFINPNDVIINVLSPMEIFTFLHNSERWSNFFDVVFVGAPYFPFLKKEFGKILKKESLFIAETKVMTTLHNTEVDKFNKMIQEYAANIDTIPLLNYNSLNTYFTELKFKKIQ